MQLIKARQHLVVGHDLVIKGNHVAFAYLDGDIILLPELAEALSQPAN